MPDTASAAVHLIVFSKDRPLQLHGMLTSVFRHWRGAYRVTVLARTEGPYFSAYEDVWREFRDRDVVLLTETDFPEDLSAALAMNGETTPYACFGCDDVVYTLALDVSRVADTLRVNHGLLGYSLRLGLHTQADMFGREMPRPAGAFSPLSEHGGGVWDVAGPGATGDWAYPWEVLGTVYRWGFVRRLVSLLARDNQAGNPSLLEHNGAQRWREAADGRSLLACGATARLVVPTVNVVQSVFGNGTVGPGVSPEFLLNCWNHGLRLDVERYRGMAPPSWRIGDLYLRSGGEGAAA